MKCVFSYTGEVWECRGGRQIVAAADADPMKMHAQCTCVADRDLLGCVHLVEVIGEIHVPGCGCPGNITSVWRCAVHGSCTPLARGAAGHASCHQCGDYRSE